MEKRIVKPVEMYGIRSLKELRFTYRDAELERASEGGVLTPRDFDDFFSTLQEDGRATYKGRQIDITEARYFGVAGASVHTDPSLSAEEFAQLGHPRYIHLSAQLVYQAAPDTERKA